MPGDAVSLDRYPIVDIQDRIGFFAMHPRYGRELFAIHGAHAIARSVGRGCGTPGVPRLSTADPVQGQPLRIRINDAPALANGLLAIGLPRRGLYVGGDCTLWVDTTAPIILALRTDKAGDWKLVGVTVPNQASLRGLTLAAQAFVSSPTTAPLAIAFSNGLHLIPSRN